jgi:hypothetical protein
VPQPDHDRQSPDFGIGMTPTWSVTGVVGLIQSGHRQVRLGADREAIPPGCRRRPHDVSRSCAAPAYTATSSTTAVALRRVGWLTQPNLQNVSQHEREVELTVTARW